MILCADDFGQNAKISQGILNLAEKHRLSAISCMSQMPAWTDYALALCHAKQNNPHLQVGIHFNLTHDNSDLVKPLAHWLILSKLGMINREAIYNTFNRQCDLFEAKMKQEPNFIDGHQHVHVFPMIRDVIIDTIKKRYAHNLPFVRNVHPIPNQGITLKKTILQFMALGLTELLTNHHIAHNRYFAGLYDLNPNKQKNRFKNLISHWFESEKNDTLIMCHPGLLSEDLSDPIRSTRFIEYTVLASDWFNERYARQLCSKVTQNGQ